MKGLAFADSSYETTVPLKGALGHLVDILGNWGESETVERNDIVYEAQINRQQVSTFASNALIHAFKFREFIRKKPVNRKDVLVGDKYFFSPRELKEALGRVRSAGLGSDYGFLLSRAEH